MGTKIKKDKPKWATLTTTGADWLVEDDEGLWIATAPIGVRGEGGKSAVIATARAMGYKVRGAR